MKLRLEVLDGPGRGQVAVVGGGVSLLGRDATCALVIAEPNVSREHAVIRGEEGRFVIEDLGSRIGTFVNGHRTRKAMLSDGDTVRIGTTQLRVRAVEGLSGEIPPEEVEVVRTSAPRQTIRMGVEEFQVRMRERERGATDQLRPPTGQLARPETPLDADAADAGKLEQLCGLSIALASNHNADALAREATARLWAMFPHLRRVGLFEVEEERDSGDPVLRPRYVRDLGPRDEGVRVQVSLSALQAAIQSHEAIVSQDVRLDPRFQLSQSLADAGVVSIVCVPLIVGERIVGALYVDTADPDRPFQAHDLRLITGVGAVLAAALENARLFARVQEETARRANLERYFAPDLVERVLKGEVPLARQGRSTEGTILFIDIRGFTRITDTTEPKRLVEVLNAYFAAMQHIIFRSGGTVERFGGDSILAYWGVVERDLEHQAHGAGAALAMLAEAWRLNPELEAGGGPTLRVAVGLNSGQVVVGDVGGPERYEFTILGTAINLARRLESLAGPWEVIAGADTVQALGDRALTVPLPPTTVKGRDTAVAASAVYGLKVSGDAAALERWDLALESTLDLGRGPSIALVTGLLRRGANAWLEVMTPADPPGGTATRVVLRPPRSQQDLTCSGRTMVEEEETVDETLIGLRALPREAVAMRRVRVAVQDAPALLHFLGIAP